MTRLTSLARVAAFAALIGAAAYVALRQPTASVAEAPAKYLSPMDMVLTPDGVTLYVSNHTGNSVGVIDTQNSTYKGAIPVPGAPAGLALSPDAKTLYVAQAETNSVSLIDTATRKVQKTVPVGWYPWGVAVAADGTVVVCNRDSNDVSVVDPAAGKELRRLPASREPMYAAVAGEKVIVTNGLPNCPASDHTSAASVTLASLDGKTESKQLRMSPGCNALRQIVVSKDGKWAYFVHLLSRFNVPTTQLDRGWMNTNALTVFDVEKGEVYVTILLDEIMRGYANPYGITLTADGEQLLISHAGSDDATFIDVKRLHEYVSSQSDEDRHNLQNRLSVVHGKDVGDHFNCGGKGPRGIAVSADRRLAYVANYFSDNVTVIDLKRQKPVHTIPLGPEPKMDEVRKGEMLFYDATICFQHWQSCSSCHPDTRADGFNWDLLNDDIGNPKNVKSMVLSYKTPPVMSLGVRDTMETAVVSGIRYIQFREPEPGEAEAIQTYLRALKPRPSPYLLAKGKLSPAAERGKKLFESPKTACSTCHPAPLYTDLHKYDVGSHGEYDREDKEFDTPTLIEGFRPAPYMHDGSKLTFKDVLTQNAGDKHGNTSQLKPQEIDDLVAFLLAL